MSSTAFADSRFGPQAILRLQAAFDGSRNPMLIADDQRRWVTGNVAACRLFGIGLDEVSWRTIDDFTPPSELTSLEAQWKDFLIAGEAEGWYQLFAPELRPVPVEFSATANVLPARHLTVFIPPEIAAHEPIPEGLPRVTTWSPVVGGSRGRLPLTEREREVMTLVASGHQTGEMAQRLFLSPETIKSHVQNAMVKLGAHTRAHAVAIGLVSGQITWSLPADGRPKSS
jgi:DNA-binding CsgD family transcriptional regulator